MKCYFDIDKCLNIEVESVTESMAMELWAAMEPSDDWMKKMIVKKVRPIELPEETDER